MSRETAANLLNEGWHHQQSGNIGVATRLYKAALEKPTEEREIPMLACLNLGNIAFDRRDYEEATKWYTRATEINPSNCAPYFNLAGVFRDTDRHQEAITYYGMAIDRDPNDPDCHRNLALVYVKIGENTLAAGELEKCIKLNPGADPRDYFNLGLIYYNAGHQLGAMVNLFEFIKAAPAGCSDSLATAKRLLDQLKDEAGYPRTRKKMVVENGRLYVIDEEIDEESDRK